MKIIMKQKDIEDIEIEIRYKELNTYVDKLIKRIENFTRSIIAEHNGTEYKVRIDEIFYVECVDKKTFIYTKNQVFRTKKKLYQMHDELAKHDFIQISKSCILSINIMESMKRLPNSRIEVTLSNGEKLNVSRTYIPTIKKILSIKGGY